VKLARIQHWRCSEAQESTFVWVPDDFTEQQLDALVTRAVDDCLNAERNFEGGQRAYPNKWQLIEKADKSTSIAVVEASLAEQIKEYEAWEARRKAARKSFAQRLKDLSEGKVNLFWEIEDWPLEATASWGHNHGVQVDYGETEL
jgi:hypothetical protein